MCLKAVEPFFILSLPHSVFPYLLVTCAGNDGTATLLHRATVQVETETDPARRRIDDLPACHPYAFLPSGRNGKITGPIREQQRHVCGVLPAVLCRLALPLTDVVTREAAQSSS